MAAQGRGGPRHHTKPYVDSGLVFKVLSECRKLVADMGAYEHLSRTNAPDAYGLLQTMPLWKGLLKVESSGEIHSQPLRHALLSLLAHTPGLNTTAHTGQVWANLKVERICTILFHVRKVARDKEGKLQTAAARLRREKFEALRDGLMLLDNSCENAEKILPPVEAPLEKGKGEEKEPLEKGEGEKKEALEKGTGEEKECLPLACGTKQNLKKNESDVSMNSQGYPSMFDTPDVKKRKTGASGQNEAKEGAPVWPVAFERRRLGQKTKPLGMGELTEALGFGKA